MLRSLVIALCSSCLPAPQCPKPVPSPAPTPPPAPPPAPNPSPCSRDTMPPLVRQWLAKSPVPPPNSDELGLLESWAMTACADENQPQPSTP